MPKRAQIPASPPLAANICNALKYSTARNILEPMRYTFYHSPFTIHHSPFTIHHSPFTIHHSPASLSFSMPEPLETSPWCYLITSGGTDKIRTTDIAYYSGSLPGPHHLTTKLRYRRGHPGVLVDKDTESFRFPAAIHPEY
jgi:hypothetical protein